MRTHGWSGSAPASDEEAIARILVAAGNAIDERGADFSIADVARTLGVTRLEGRDEPTMFDHRQTPVHIVAPHVGAVQVRLRVEFQQCVAQWFVA